MTEKTGEKIITEVKKILTPKLNEFVVDSTIRVNCKRIGISSEDLGADNLPEFSEKIKVSLLLFLGKEETNEIVQKIKEIKV